MRLFHFGCVLLFCPDIWSASLSDATGPSPFQVGEKLTYHFYWGIFMVGRGTFEVTEINKDGHHVFVVQGRSNDLIAAFYPVDDILRSFFDLRKMRSVRFEQNRKEGGKHIWEEIFFYYELEKGSMESYVTGEKKWFEIPKGGVQDKLSLIYYMRCLDWKTRENASVILGNDKHNYEVRVSRLKKETFETDDFEPIPTFRVEPNAEYLSGFVKGGKIRVWVSDDRFKIPVRVEAELSVGTIGVSLVKVEGVEGWPYDIKD